ncbi:MAG: histidine phosphatase family protein [Candidatus Shapirobacteria bacterium]
MNTYYLIRHGQNYDNVNGILNGHRDLPLSEIGINQAIELGHKLKEINLTTDIVLTSPLNRTYVTASIVSSLNNYSTPIVEPLLIERDFGVMSGQKQTDIEKLCSPDIIKTDTVTYFLNPQGAETFPDLINRAKKLLTQLESQYSNKKIMLVSHGDFGKMVYAAFYKLEWKDVLVNFHFGNSELLLLSSEIEPKDSKLVNIKQFNL